MVCFETGLSLSLLSLLSLLICLSVPLFFLSSFPGLPVSWSKVSGWVPLRSSCSTSLEEILILESCFASAAAYLNKPTLKGTVDVIQVFILFKSLEFTQKIPIYHLILFRVVTPFFKYNTF